MSASPCRLDRALAGGLAYILACQAADGSWTDWELPVGFSSTWTTAYVGLKLASLPESLRAGLPLRAAARWLLANRFADGGWGFNPTAGSDADSTSCAILFLASTGWQAPEAACHLLARHQHPQGGFSTYLPDGLSGSWSVPHSDVTPIALLALLTQPGPDPQLLARGIAAVLKQRTPDGWWESFWWDSRLYATAANLSFLRAAKVEIGAPNGLSRIAPRNAFETALLISGLCDANQAGVGDLVGQLIEQQQPDGSWKSAPILRITRRDCFEPWRNADPGPLFCDPNRLFTTATVLHALSRASVSY